MPPIFASSDVALLVQAFPTPTPTRDHASLVKSRSGDNLLNSRTILGRFNNLLESRHERIRRSDLPSLLGIEKTEWLFDCYDGAVRLSKDKQSIVPEQIGRASCRERV